VPTCPNLRSFDTSFRPLTTADLSFPQEFGIGASIDQPGGAKDEWIVGFVNSAPYISAALCGCWRKSRFALSGHD
jgi:hypothetical protein